MSPDTNLEIRRKKLKKYPTVPGRREQLKKNRSARVDGTIGEPRKNDLDLPSQTKTT